MKKILAMVLVVATVQVFAAPVVSVPFESTTSVSSEVQSQAVAESQTTFWSSATTWNAGTIDVLRRVLTGMILLFK